MEKLKTRYIEAKQTNNLLETENNRISAQFFYMSQLQNHLQQQNQQLQLLQQQNLSNLAASATSTSISENATVDMSLDLLLSDIRGDVVVSSTTLDPAAEVVVDFDGADSSNVEVIKKDIHEDNIDTPEGESPALVFDDGTPILVIDDE